MRLPFAIWFERAGVLQRTAALSLAIGIAVLAWQEHVAPPRVVAAANGIEYRQQQAFWIQLALLVVSQLLQSAFGPKQAKPKPAMVDDFEIPQANEGTPFSWTFGEKLKKAPQVAWWDNFYSTPIKSKGSKK